MARVATFMVSALASVACDPPVPPADYGPAPTPVLFAPGVVSTDAPEYGITFTPDGREAYFTRRSRRERAMIYVSRFEDGMWSEAELAAFSLEGGEGAFISRDGERLFFASDRAIPGEWWSEDRGERIWTAKRRADGWSAAMPLPGTVNEVDFATAGDEDDEDDDGWELDDLDRAGPVLLDARTLLYWASNGPDWREDLYVAYAQDGGFVSPTPLSPRVNTSGSEFNPALSPDGRFLVFQGYRGPEGHGEDDLYIAERMEYGFASPRLLPMPFNSEDNDGYPAFSPDGRYFFFASERGPDEDWSIYLVETAAMLRAVGDGET